MEQETDELLKHVDSIKANYGNDILDLIAACKYAQRLLANTRVHRYLAKHHEESRNSNRNRLNEGTVLALAKFVGAPRRSRRVPSTPGDCWFGKLTVD
jgi:hypothetical protein